MKWNFKRIAGCWGFLALIQFLFATVNCSAAATPESHAFEVAADFFKSHNWEKAEEKLADFAKKYPTSEFFADAVLLQGESRYALGRDSGVVELLSTEMPHAGKLADQYLYWTAVASYRSANYKNAADSFSRIVTVYTNSAKRAEAIFSQSQTLGKMGAWPEAIKELRQPDGAFQQLLKSNPTNEFAIKGVLLLAEADLIQKDYQAVSEDLRIISQQKLTPEFKWRSQLLFCRSLFEAGKTDEALQAGTNLNTLAVETGNLEFIGESVAFQANVLEKLGRLADAVEVYENFEKKLSAETPKALRRQAIYKIVDLNLKQNKLDIATQKLDSFLSKFPEDRTADVALLTLGELQLRQATTTGLTPATAAVTLPGTNLLSLAKANFQKLINSFTNSDFVGAAQLNLGWCLWLENKPAESRTAFSNALQRLPQSESQAVARFKLADIQFTERDFHGALTNYIPVVEEYKNFPLVRSNLFERSLYQITRAALAETNITQASQAMAKILDLYPNTLLSDSSALLVGQGMTEYANPAGARDLLQMFIEKSPTSPLSSEVRLAIAHTYEKEGNWQAAITNYDRLIVDSTNSAVLPRVEFSRAMANFRAGYETNAYSILTNFVVKFSTNQLAAKAKYWIGDYFWRQEDFPRAERSYKEVYQNWPAATNEGLQAQMMAGRAAMARENYYDATTYFTNLTILPQCPAPLRLEALFAYGSAMMGLAPLDTTNSVAHYNTAIGIFLDIQKNYSTNSVAPMAAGEVGNCYLQMAVQDASQYDRAATYYKQAIDSPVADVHTRGLAQLGLAKTLEGLAHTNKTAAEQGPLLKQAMNLCEEVVFTANLRAGEEADLYCISQNGLEAGKLAEELGLWEHALKLYSTLCEKLPPLKPTLQERITKTGEKLARQKAEHGV
ncbi:tetratricopeptide repeat protein [Pedosphaera parvula]|uniref:Tetratricopeptide domain protein n=1 Tax=Pedosphaera parvula (strain Ellin514) TaxID=320771 RepID=B9XIT7_PEDPL|nr:tetratricopeptide repeat protein [Pedosphaera parvula]EEF60164.1 Tetratricopeptide domain protein [Pedosphaera parvula Ellin514]